MMRTTAPLPGPGHGETLTTSVPRLLPFQSTMRPSNLHPHQLMQALCRPR